MVERGRKTQMRRYPSRGSTDRETLNAILDTGLVCHVGFLFDGYPVVTPTLYWREGDALYWHGSSASRMMQAAADRDVCVTISLIDGIVFARSAYHHSVNYRSVMIFGRATRIDKASRKLAHLQAMMESIAANRFEQLRPIKDKELEATAVLTLPLDHYSIKSRSGGVQEDKADRDWPVWAGVVPWRLALEPPESEPDCLETLAPPQLVRPR